jgi:hypothetical protein
VQVFTGSKTTCNARCISKRGASGGCRGHEPVSWRGHSRLSPGRAETPRLAARVCCICRVPTFFPAPWAWLGSLLCWMPCWPGRRHLNTLQEMCMRAVEKPRWGARSPRLAAGQCRLGPLSGLFPCVARLGAVPDRAGVLRDGRLPAGRARVRVGAAGRPAQARGANGAVGVDGWARMWSALLTSCRGAAPGMGVERAPWGVPKEHPLGGE